MRLKHVICQTKDAENSVIRTVKTAERALARHKMPIARTVLSMHPTLTFPAIFTDVRITVKIYTVSVSTELTDVIKTVPFAAAAVPRTERAVQPACARPPIARTAKNPSMILPMHLNAAPSIKPSLVPEQQTLIPVPSITISAAITAPMSKALPVNKASADPMNALTALRSIILLPALTDVPTQKH